MQMRGKWAEGIEPRHFHWILKGQLAVCERPGGYGAHHRRVRRMEEIIWIRRNEFNRVISIIDAPHNLHNYDEYDVRYVHRPIFVGDYTPRVLEALFIDLTNLLENGEKLLLHHEELGDLLCGSMAGYLVWSRLVEAPPEAITVIERITGRVLGPVGRELVAASKELAGDRA